MAEVIVVGGGICGLGLAILLARDGHEVTVLERDADPPPESAASAWDAWTRKGIAQFHQPHNLMPGPDDFARGVLGLFVAAASDPDVFHALFEYVATVTPIHEILERPAVHAAIEAVGDAAPMEMPGPHRAQLLDLLA